MNSTPEIKLFSHLNHSKIPFLTLCFIIWIGLNAKTKILGIRKDYRTGAMLLLLCRFDRSELKTLKNVIIFQLLFAGSQTV